MTLLSARAIISKEYLNYEGQLLLIIFSFFNLVFLVIPRSYVLPQIIVDFYQRPRDTYSHLQKLLENR